MIRNSHRSGISIRASQRTGSRARYRWPLALQLPGLILLASFAPPAASTAHGGGPRGGGGGLLGGVLAPITTPVSPLNITALSNAPAAAKTQSAATIKARLHDQR